MAKVNFTTKPSTVARTGMESNATGGGQARGVSFGQSDCGAGQDLSPPKLAHSFDSAAGLTPSNDRFSQNGPSSSPAKRNCITRPMAGTITASTWPLFRKMAFDQP